MQFLAHLGIFVVLSAALADPLPWESRIVNGSPAEGAANSTVSLQMEYCMYRNVWQACSAIPKPAQPSAPRGYSHFCTGSMVAEDLVLTAAHCCDPMLQAPKEKYRAVGGVTTLTDSLGVKQFITIQNIYKHPQYNAAMLHNDICLFRLEAPLVTAGTSDRVKVVKFTTDAPGQDYFGTAIKLFGWGQTITTGSTSTVLNVANVVGASKAECVKAYGDIVTEKTICTSTRQYTGTCSGDSGGPVMKYDPLTGEDRLIGVISFVSSKGCASGEGHPDGHQAIKFYMDWMCSIVTKYRTVSWCN